MTIRLKDLAPSAAVTGVAAVAVLAALVAVIGSAQAAPSTKFYDATVRVKLGTEPSSTGATLTLTFRNDSRSKQPLGSARFTPPAGMQVNSSPTTPVDADTNTLLAGWTAGQEGNVVTFLSGSTGVALAPGKGVSTSVGVTITQGQCASPDWATWSTRAKQSNDFSGNPGNDATLKLDRSNLRPLGSFSFGGIGTQIPGGPFVNQQILTSPPSATTPVGLTAFDVCGAPLTNYGTPEPGHFGDAAVITAAADVPPLPRLDDATISPIAWKIGTNTGSATIAPVVVETGDKLIVTDNLSGIDATSEDFDVVEKLCYNGLAVCEWQDRQGNPRILAKADPPPSGASLGIGFNPNLPTFSCNGEDKDDLVGGTFININPRDYAASATVTITLTYKKSITGNGPASNFDLCLSDDNGQTWTKTDVGGPVPACSSTNPAATEAPCTKEKKRITGGDLSVILFIDADDPWGGLS